MGQTEQSIQQTSVILPYFESEVPVLCLQDGTRYIPVIALCQMLGLRANTYIPRWRKLVLWHHARKLPWRTPTGRTRVVWCLHIGALPFWYCCFDWSLVTTIRQAQLHQALDAWLKATAQAQQEMLREYRQMRRHLFGFLTVYANAEATLSQAILHLYPLLGGTDVWKQLEKLVAEGYDLIRRAIDHAREMLHAQAATPILDAVKLDGDGQVTETCSLPLFPVVPREERTRFFQYIELLSDWYQEFAAFLRSAGEP